MLNFLAIVFHVWCLFSCFAVIIYMNILIGRKRFYDMTCYNNSFTKKHFQTKIIKIVLNVAIIIHLTR